MWHDQKQTCESLADYLNEANKHWTEKKRFYVYEYLPPYMHGYLGPTGQKRALDPLGLELQTE